MFHSEFKLDCFEEIQAFARKFLEAYDGDEVYSIKPVPVPEELMTKFNKELISYSLPRIGSTVAFKRRNCFLSEETGVSKYIHVDSTASRDTTFTSLIIPVDNCEDTYMYYYEGDYIKTPTTIVNGTVPTQHTFWNNPPQIIGRICVDKNPAIARVHLPHDAVSRKDGTYRSVITFRFFGNPSFEEVYEKLKKHDRIIERG